MRMFHSLIGISTDSLPASLKALFSVLWMGQVSGNTLVDESGNGNDITVTGKDFTTTIPNTSSATLALADQADLKTDDNFDGLWFNDAGTVRNVTPIQLIENDYTRTIVKYSDASPYDIEWIGILDDASTPTADQLNQLHTYFTLHYFWSGTFNDYGYLKDNKPLEAIDYKRWSVTIDENSYTQPSTTVQSSISKFIHELKDNSIYMSDFDRLQMFMLNDASLVSTTGIVNLCDPSKTCSFTVAPTYSTRGIHGNGSNMYVNMGFNPLSTGVNLKANSGSVGAYVFSTGAANHIVGHTGGFSFWVTGTNGRYNSGGFPSFTFSGENYVALNRSAVSGTNCVQGYRGTTQMLDSTAVANALPTDLFLLRANTSYSSSGLAMAFFGRNFTQSEHGTIRTAMINHKTRLGL